MAIRGHEATAFTYDSPSLLASDAAWGLMILSQSGLDEQASQGLEAGLLLCRALEMVAGKRVTRRASPEVTSTARRLYARQVPSLADANKLAERGTAAKAVLEDLLAGKRAAASSEIAEWKSYFAALAALLREAGL